MRSTASIARCKLRRFAGFGKSTRLKDFARICVHSIPEESHNSHCFHDFHAETPDNGIERLISRIRELQAAHS
jgi:hypothetical protein